MIVSSPASSANLGSGFDCLALAVDLPFALSDEPPPSGEGWLAAEPTHPGTVAFRAAGGDPATELHWRSPIPPGRGLGFSGASRVAGAFLAGLCDGLEPLDARDGAFRVAAELEGHADNAAASAHGGFVVSAGEHVGRLVVPPGLVVLVWSPSVTTSTDASRRALPDVVPLSDASHSIAGAALWVAGLATCDLSLLRRACEDRLHQPVRLGSQPGSTEALEVLLGNDSVLAAWLSGSGPTVAALLDVGADGATLCAELPSTGRCRTLDVATLGVHQHDPTGHDPTGPES